MKLSSYAQQAAPLFALMIVGCGKAQQTADPTTALQQGSEGPTAQPSANEDNTASRPTNGADNRVLWTLADGKQFSSSTEGSGRANEPVWIWCDVSPGPVNYRIISNGVAGEWKEMRQSDVSDDNKLIDDPTGKFGAVETLPPGSYSVEFKVGTEEFSQIPVSLK